MAVLFTLLLALRLHGERKFELPDAAGVFLRVFFFVMVGFSSKPRPSRTKEWQLNLPPPSFIALCKR